MEPASAGFGVRILGEVDPARPELAYVAAGELASRVFGLSGAATSSPGWASALCHLLVAVSRLPTWAGVDRLLGHSSTWVEDVHVGGVLTGGGRRRVSELAGLARLDECESLQVFVAWALREMEGEGSQSALDELVARTRWPSVRVVAAGQPIGAGERSEEVSRWLEDRAEARALASQVQLDELAALLRDDDRALGACAALALWGEGGKPAQVGAAARLLESVLDVSPRAELRSAAARARARTEIGSLAERVWFLRFDDRENIRATLVHAFKGDEARLTIMLDDPSDYVASWAVMDLASIETPTDETVTRVASLALERARSEAAAEAVEVFAESWKERLPDPDFVRMARANITDGRWSPQVIRALSQRSAPELADAVRGWEPVSEYEAEIRAEALAACKKPRS
jgi:hypothetical protein